MNPNYFFSPKCYLCGKPLKNLGLNNNGFPKFKKCNCLNNKIILKKNMDIKRNLWIIPTDKEIKNVGDLVKNKYGNIHIFTKNDGKEYGKTTTQIKIYITSDEEIKIGDWFITDHLLWKANQNIHLINPKRDKKIILTTSQDLIKDGVQAIDNEFLEFFVKNPSCKEVKTKNYFEKFGEMDSIKYKIIFPKEEEVLLQSSIDGEVIWGEPKQETSKYLDNHIIQTTDDLQNLRQLFKKK